MDSGAEVGNRCSIPGEQDENPVPRTYGEVFEQACPTFMAMGMSVDEFWWGDVSLARYYLQADVIRKRRENERAWLQGLYVYEAISAIAPAINPFIKSKAKPYLEEPHPLDAEQLDSSKRREKERAIAQTKAHMEAFKARFDARRKGKDDDGGRYS